MKQVTVDRWYILLLIGITLVALLPRALDLGGFVTNDEASFWLRRSEVFLEALQTGDYAATAISTHPGVTTMWLGSGGIILRRTLREWGIVAGVPYPLLLALMRLPGVLVHTAGIALGYMLLRRMLPASVAFLAALLWAADPFLIGYSRVLHVDALMTTFATLSVLAACAYWYHNARPATLILSGICAGLAVLSKSPALALLPTVAGIALLAVINGKHAMMSRLWPLVAWGGVFALTLVLVWPAVWAEPLRVYELLRTGVQAEGAQPHMTGNFFLGEPVETPGLRFYPVALVFRLTPITLVGLLLLPWAWRSWREDQAHTPARRSLVVLLGFALFFMAAMSLFPKKFDRYLLPIFPALDILAAVGLIWSIERLTGSAARKMLHRVAVGAVALLAVVNAAWWHPYSLAAFNQALGGTYAGAQTFSVGWGEGFDQVADWLNQQPDITGVVTASIMTPVLNPYLKWGAQATTPAGASLPERTGYVVVYIYQAQGTVFPPFDRFYSQEQPLHTVTIHGVEYAWIYQVPPPVAHELDARFGPHISLRGYTVDTSAVQTTGVLSLTVQWQTDEPVSEQYMLFAHLLDASGQRVGQTDAPPAGPDTPGTTWQPGRVYTWLHPVPVWGDLSPGDYQLALGLYDPRDSSRLPIHIPGQTDVTSSDDALLLPVTIR